VTNASTRSESTSGGPTTATRDDFASAADAPAVAASGLCKRFGTVRALDDVSLRIPRGGIYAVLGPNGAGKSTLIKVLATLTRPSAGAARVLGYDVVSDGDAVRRRISLTAQFASIDEDLTAVENLVLLARLRGWSWRAARQRADDLLTAFDLTGAARRTARTFSGGMRRRLDIAASLVHTPELLFLDEPTTGLDPRSRNDVWELVRATVGQGATVLLTTQYLEEADQLAARIAVIDRGAVIAEGTRAELKASVGSGRLRVRLADQSQRAEAERVLTARLAANPLPVTDPASVAVQLPQGGGGDLVADASDALAELHAAGVAVSDFAFSQPSLDEVFLALTGIGPTASDDVEETAV
jgi:daunorubicin/doxorubicin transport system ATP-binding protein